MVKKIGYRAAMDKIEAIVAELDDDDMDVDQLGERVEEAVDLIALCKKRLQASEKKVGLVLKQMDLSDDEESRDAEEAPF